MELNNLTRTLSKQERLHKKAELEYLFSKGEKYTKFPITIFITKPPSSTPFHKVVFIASKRTFPKAHQRNRVKRILREIYRNNKPCVRDGNGLYIGISMQKSELSYQSLERAFLLCLKKIWGDA